MIILINQIRTTQIMKFKSIPVKYDNNLSSNFKNDENMNN